MSMFFEFCFVIYINTKIIQTNAIATFCYDGTVKIWEMIFQRFVSFFKM